MPLYRKLGIKPGHRVLVLNAPDGYLEKLGAPDGVQVTTTQEGEFDCVQAFMRSKADIDTHGPAAIEAVRPGGLVWFAYPKKSAKVKTDISRDVGWDAMTGAGWENVAQVSIDDTWSAGRFRPSSDVSARNR